MKTGQEYTNWFGITNGVGKVEVFSQLLFNIVMEHIEGGQRVTETNILNGLAYVDHFCLLVEMVVKSSC